MADSYIDNNSGSKKKYLIPLVVLMICAVSLTGAGYAYSNNNATLETDGIALDGASLTIDLKDKSYSTDVIVGVDADTEIIDFYDHLKYTSDATTNTVSFAPADSQSEAATGASLVTVKTSISYTDDTTDVPLAKYVRALVKTTGYATTPVDLTQALTNCKIELLNGSTVVGEAKAVTLANGTVAYDLVSNVEVASGDYDLVIIADVGYGAFTESFTEAKAAAVNAELQAISFDIQLIVSESAITATTF